MRLGQRGPEILYAGNLARRTTGSGVMFMVKIFKPPFTDAEVGKR